ncbi:hypothetical protein FQN52_007135 [Onygenales sp. PD_12]|nr:hypothetical protein FQN52_007135 [Onygenales sp. PD_12]
MATPTSKPFPNPNGMRSFWHTEPHKLENHRSTENLPSECDVLIVGAGYAGVSTAYHILQDNPSPPSITILEARSVCFGATGRNGKFLSLTSSFDEHGLEAAAELSNFEAAHIPAIREIIEREGIDCDFHVTRSFAVVLREDYWKHLETAYRRLRASGIPFTQDLQFTSSKDAERISGMKDAKGCFHYTAGHIWPYKLVLHLLSLLVGRGVNVQTHTPVTRISDHPDPTTGTWTVTTPRGTIRAKKVILATNAYTGSIAPQYSSKIIPTRGNCSHIVTPRGKKAPYLPNTYGIIWGPQEFDYLIPRPDGSIIVGGGRQNYVRDMGSWYGNFDDSEAIQSAKNYFDGYMQRHFVGWEDSGAYTEQVWSGVMGFTTDLFPHVGPVPGKPNQYILAGFSGHGMPMAFLTGKGIAKMIRDENLPFEKTGIPRLYRTTQKRLDSDENKILTAKFGFEKSDAEVRAKI